MEATGSAQTNNCVANFDKNVRPNTNSFRLAAISQHCWFIKVSIGNSDIKMLVDTVSAITLLSKQIFDSLRKVELENELSILTTADEEPMAFLGPCTMNLCIANDEFSQLVMVGDLENLERVFGLDFSARNYVIFDTGKGVLKL